MKNISTYRNWLFAFLFAITMIMPQSVWAADTHYDAGYGSAVIECKDGTDYMDLHIVGMRIYNYQGNNSHWYGAPTISVTVDGNTHTLSFSNLYSGDSNKSFYYQGEGGEDSYKGNGSFTKPTYDKSVNGLRVAAWFTNQKNEQSVSGSGNASNHDGKNKWCTADLYVRVWTWRKASYSIKGTWRDASGGVNNNESVTWSFSGGYPHCTSVTAVRSGKHASISWTASAADSNGTFDIWRCTSSGNRLIKNFLSSGTTTSYSCTDNDVCGDTYTYYVTYRPSDKGPGSSPTAYPGLYASASSLDLSHSYINYTYNNDVSALKDGTCTGYCRYCNASDTKTDSSHPKWTYSVKTQDANYGTVSGSINSEGTTYNVTASPKTGYTFGRWSDGSKNYTTNPLAYTMTGNTLLTAYFKTTLTLNVNNSQMGTVSGGGTYECGTSVSPEATSAKGCKFVKWNDGSTDATHAAITLTAPKTLTATFEALPEVTLDKEKLRTALENISSSYTLAFASSVPAGATAGAELNSDGTILLYAKDTTYTVVPKFSGVTILAPEDCSGLFSGCSKLTSLDLSNFNTTAVTNMSYMFSNCSNLRTLTFGSSFNTANVTTMRTMFQSCSSLTSLDLSKFSTANVTNMYHMFYECSSLRSLTFGSSFNTEKVTDMSTMFQSCSSLQSLTFGRSFNTASVTNMSYMFAGCSSLTSLDLSKYSTANVTDMQYMFSECTSLTSLDLSNFNTEKVQCMEHMFFNCKKLSTITVSSKFTTASVTNSNNMFICCYDLKGNRGTTFSSSNPSDKTYAHGDGGTAAPGYFTAIPVTLDNSMLQTALSNISSNYTLAFAYSAPANASEGAWLNSEQSIRLYSVGSAYTIAPVTPGATIFAPASCSEMFYDCETLTSLDLTNFDTHNVKNMTGMFYNCKALTSLDLSNFNTANVTKMNCMFEGCSQFTSLDLTSFNTHNVVDMSRMFYDCSQLATITVSSNFTTASVTDSEEMFSGCIALKGDHGTTYGSQDATYARFDGGTAAPGYFSRLQVEIDKDLWDAYLEWLATQLQSLTFAYSAPADAIEGAWLNSEQSIRLYQVGPGYIAAPVTPGAMILAPANSSEMFYCCSSLTSLDLTNFDTRNVTDMNYMFSGCKSLTSIDLSSFDTRNVTYMYGMFYNCWKLTSLDLTSFDTRNVTDMKNMFSYSWSLTSLDLANFDTRNVTDMESMFDNCTGLEQLTIGNFDMSSVTKITNIFKNSKVLNFLTMKSMPYLADGTFNTKFSGEDKTVNCVLDDNSVVYTGANYLPALTSAPTYTHTMAPESQWGAVVLPFQAVSNDDVQLYQLTGIATMTLTPVASVEANIPCVFKKKNASATSVIFTAGSKNVSTNIPATPAASAVEGLTLTGAYASTQVTTGAGYVLDDAGCFALTTANTDVVPFGAYLKGSIEDLNSIVLHLEHLYNAQADATEYLAVAPTCTQDGVYYHKCSLCQAKGTSTWVKSGTTVPHDLNNFICKDCQAQPAQVAAGTLEWGKDYKRTSDCTVADLTFTRDFADADWQTWYEPFELTLTAGNSEGYEFARINNVHQYEDENGNIDQTVVECFRITGKLHANYPYIVKKVNGSGTMTINTENAALQSATESSIVCESMDYTYTFTGNYQDKSISSIFALDGGDWTAATQASAQTHYLTITPRADGYSSHQAAPARVLLQIIGEEDATGIVTLYTETKRQAETYTLSGQRLAPGAKGLQIRNGKTMFVK